MPPGGWLGNGLCARRGALAFEYRLASKPAGEEGQCDRVVVVTSIRQAIGTLLTWWKEERDTAILVSAGRGMVRADCNAGLIIGDGERPAPRWKAAAEMLTTLRNDCAKRVNEAFEGPAPGELR